MERIETVDRGVEEMRIGTSVKHDDDPSKHGKVGRSSGTKPHGGVLADRIARFRSAPPRPRPERSRYAKDF
jgi:hypothetical protein